MIQRQIYKKVQINWNIRFGDVVTYKVKIKSLVPGTTITNVNIKEVIPKGLDLKEDSGKISINRYRNSKWSC